MDSGLRPTSHVTSAKMRREQNGNKDDASEMKIGVKRRV